MGHSTSNRKCTAHTHTQTSTTEERKEEEESKTSIKRMNTGTGGTLATSTLPMPNPTRERDLPMSTTSLRPNVPAHHLTHSMTTITHQNQNVTDLVPLQLLGTSHLRHVTMAMDKERDVAMVMGVMMTFPFQTTERGDLRGTILIPLQSTSGGRLLQERETESRQSSETDQVFQPRWSLLTIVTEA